MKRSIWFSRLVLAGSALLLTRVGAANVLNPVGEASRFDMALGSPDAITVLRVEGGLFVGIAAVLVYCLVSERRLLAGLGFFATLITAITAARLLGLVIDGPGPFTLMVLKPEVGLVLLSTLALFFEWRRARPGPRARHQLAPTPNPP